MFEPGKSFQPYLILASKAWAYQSGVPERSYDSCLMARVHLRHFLAKTTETETNFILALGLIGQIDKIE